MIDGEESNNTKKRKNRIKEENKEERRNTKVRIILYIYIIQVSVNFFKYNKNERTAHTLYSLAYLAIW